MNIRDLDLNLLVIFAALLKEQNVTQVAKKLGMAQPSVSHALNRLRSSLNDPLFVRSNKGMEPTPFAIHLAPFVLESLETLQEGLKCFMSFEPTSSDRCFKLLMSDAAQTLVLPLLIQHLKKIAPRVKITILALPRESYTNALENDLADLAVGNLYLSHNSLYQQRLFNADYVCLARKGHPDLSAQEKIPLASYTSIEHLTVSKSMGDAMVLHALTQLGLARVISLEVPSFLAILPIVENSDLIATAPSTLVDSQRARSAIEVYSLPFTLPKTNVRQFWHQRYHSDPGHRWFRQQLALLCMEVNR